MNDIFSISLSDRPRNWEGSSRKVKEEVTEEGAGGERRDAPKLSV